MDILHVTEQNFQTQVLQSKRPVLLDFWATWCGPCQMIAPIVEEIAQQNPDLLVGKVDVDQQPKLAQMFGITSIPTLVVMKDGKQTNRMVGFAQKEQILKLLQD